jgi:hypothetical protein
MLLLSWLRRWTATSAHERRYTCRPAAFRPELQALEGRDVPSFSPAASYPLGTLPEAVVTADVNNDGKLDLLTANPSTNTVGVMLGKGNGTFAAAHNYAAGAGPVSLAVGDLNNDGKPDIVTANSLDNSISVLLGDGKGAFGPAQKFSVGPRPYSVALADFNGDGKLDVATANFGTDQYGSGSTVGVLIGNGNGTLAAAQSYAADAGSATILAADFNGDGKVDLLTEHQGGLSVSLRLGAGDGTFGTAQTVVSFQGLAGEAVYLTGLAVGDFNGDGAPDFAVSYGFGNVLWSGVPKDSVTIGINQGRGTFALPFVAELPVGDTHNTIAIADVTGDGKADIIAVGVGDSGYGVCVLPGNGDGTFGSAEFSIISPSTLGPYAVSVAVGDFNGDGSVDLAVADYGTNAVEVLLNSTSGGHHHH